MKIISVIAPIDINLSCQDLFYILNILKKPEYVSFLDSSLIPNKYSNFSYIAWEPDFVVKGFIGRNELLNINDSSVVISYENPLIFLKKVFSKNILMDNNEKKISNFGSDFIDEIEKLYFDGSEIKFLRNSKQTEEKLSGLFPDFTGGFIGYISYDLKNYIEKLPQAVKDDTGNPLFYFAYYSKLLAYSHKYCKWYLINNFNLDNDTAIFSNYPIYNYENLKSGLMVQTLIIPFLTV